MALTDGINHVATLTTDLDRLAAFYREAFDIPLVFHGRMPHPPGLRHGLLAVSSNSVIHAVEDPSSGEMFPGVIGHRGPVDHVALNVADRATLETVRDRLVAQGATDGTISHLAGILSVFYRDPDGMECEVACRHGE